MKNQNTSWVKYAVFLTLLTLILGALVFLLFAYLDSQNGKVPSDPTPPAEDGSEIIPDRPLTPDGSEKPNVPISPDGSDGSMKEETVNYKDLPLPAWLSETDGVIRWELNNLSGSHIHTTSEGTDISFFSLYEMQDILLNRLETLPLRSQLYNFDVYIADVGREARVGCDPRCLWIPIGPSGEELTVKEVVLNPVYYDITFENEPVLGMNVFPRSHEAYYNFSLGGSYLGEPKPNPGWDHKSPEDYIPDWAKDPSCEEVRLAGNVVAKKRINEKGEEELFYSRGDDYFVRHEGSFVYIRILKEDVSLQYTIINNTYTTKELLGFSVKPLIAGSNTEIAVSAEKAAQIQSGMTLGEAVQILGSYGKAEPMKNIHSPIVFIWNIDNNKKLVVVLTKHSFVNTLTTCKIDSVMIQ